MNEIGSLEFIVGIVVIWIAIVLLLALFTRGRKLPDNRISIALTITDWKWIISTLHSDDLHSPPDKEAKQFLNEINALKEYIEKSIKSTMLPEDTLPITMYRRWWYKLEARLFVLTLTSSGRDKSSVAKAKEMYQIIKSAAHAPPSKS